MKLIEKDKKRILNTLSKNPTATVSTVRTNLGLHKIPIEEVRAFVEENRAAHLSAVPASSALRLSDIRNRFDVPHKIRLGIKAHLSGKDAFYEDHAFRALCDVPVSQWRRSADSAEFGENRIKLNGVLHWACSKKILEAKQIMGLA